MKYRLFVIIIVTFHLSLSVVSAQQECTGANFATATSCRGDELSASEKTLALIVNDYRKQNGLPPVELNSSLSMVANRHLIDLIQNIRYLTHGWTGCPYDVKVEKTWPCLFDAPQRLNSGYEGDGYENLFRNLNGSASAAAALEAWKRSPLHNDLMLSRGAFDSTAYEAFGVAISGQYAAIWFGSGSVKKVRLKTVNAGLGLSFDALVKGLSKSLSIRADSEINGGAKWSGSSSDKSVRLEIFGSEREVTETNMSLLVKLQKANQLTQTGRDAVICFLDNLSGESAAVRRWFDETMKALADAPRASRTIKTQNRVIEVHLDGKGFLRVGVLPQGGPRAIEF